MANAKNDNQDHVHFNIDVTTTPTLFIDSYLISSNENALTLNFAQAMPDPKQQQIVSRVAMTRAQAKEFAKQLQDHIAKFEV